MDTAPDDSPAVSLVGLTALVDYPEYHDYCDRALYVEIAVAEMILKAQPHLWILDRSRVIRLRGYETQDVSIDETIYVPRMNFRIEDGTRVPVPFQVDANHQYFLDIPRGILTKVVEFCYEHLKKINTSQDRTRRERWEKNYLDVLDQGTALELARAAELFEMKDLFDLVRSKAVEGTHYTWLLNKEEFLNSYGRELPTEEIVRRLRQSARTIYGEQVAEAELETVAQRRTPEREDELESWCGALL